MPTHLRKTSIALFFVTLAIAATGYLRELALASLFGAGGEMDAFYFSIGIVQTIHDLLFVGSLGATIIPLLNSYGAAEDRLADRARFVVTATLMVGLIAGAMAIALWFLMPGIADLIAPRLSAPVRTGVIAFGKALIWLLPANALTTLFTLVLNAHGRFILAALAYLTNNLVFFIMLFLLTPVIGAKALPVASLAGPILVLPVLAVQLHRAGLLCRTQPDLSRAFLASVWRLSRTLLLSLGIGSTSGLLMVSHLTIRGFAADYREGAIAALGYAFRLYEVPLSLIANPAATMILPTVAALYVAGQTERIGEISRRILLWGLILLFPAAIVTWWEADLIVNLLLRRGNFDSAASRITAEALRGFAPAVMMEAVFVVFFRFFYAMHRPGRTVGVAALTLVSLLVLLWLTAGTAFIAVPLSLAGAFSVAAIALVVLLVHDIGWNAVPAGNQITRWLVAAAPAVMVWRLAVWIQVDDNLSQSALALAAFLLVYCLAIAIMLPDCRGAVTELMHSMLRRNRTVP